MTKTLYRQNGHKTPAPSLNGFGLAAQVPERDRRTFSEFFAGIGLMREGLERAGWRAVFANDIDPRKHSMYHGHFQDQDARFELGDIHGLDPDSVPFSRLATASFPCNDLSLAGARRGLAGEHSSAFWGFVSLLEGMKHRRPPLTLLENVPGFLTSHGGKDFREALVALNTLGYAVDAVQIDAANFVPQSRQRLFIIGAPMEFAATEKISELSLFGEGELRPKQLVDFILNNQDITWTHRYLPSLPTRSGDLSSILEDLPPDAPEWWDPDRASYLFGQMNVRHREIAERMIDAPTITYGTVFRRIRAGQCMAELRTDGIAGCLRTPRGGSGRQILFRAGKGTYAVRLLTPRECARLMGADEYIMNCPLNQALFGFGDAVCVPVIEWIARNYLNPLVESLFAAEPIPHSLARAYTVEQSG